jgi:hypothetical protein
MIELQTWQPAIGSFVGFITIFVAAFVGFRFNARRDERLRQQEVNSIATAIYAEVVMLRKYAAKMANLVAGRYERQGPFDPYFFEGVPMPAAPIYAALSSDVGKLPAGILLGVVQFHSAYEDARYWLPRLEDDEARGFSYSVLSVLHPALTAVEGIQPTLEAIEALVDISPPAEKPDIARAKKIADWEEETWAEIRAANET